MFCAARTRTLAFASIDTSKALALPGVKAMLTHENCDIIWGSGDTKNKRYLFNNPVRFAGDAVAAVAAVDRHVAEDAIRIDRRRLRGVAVLSWIRKKR